MIYWIVVNRRGPDSQWSNPTCCLCYTVYTMLADTLATLGARASAGMVLTPQSRNIPFPASEELRYYKQSLLTWYLHQWYIHIWYQEKARLTDITNLKLSVRFDTYCWCHINVGSSSCGSAHLRTLVRHPTYVPTQSCTLIHRTQRDYLVYSQYLFSRCRGLVYRVPVHHPRWPQQGSQLARRDETRRVCACVGGAVWFSPDRDWQAAMGAHTNPMHILERYTGYKTGNF